MTDDKLLISFVDWIDDQIYNNVLSRVRAHSSRYYKLWAYHPSGQNEVRYLSTIDLFKTYKQLANG